MTPILKTTAIIHPLTLDLKFDFDRDLIARSNSSDAKATLRHFLELIAETVKLSLVTIHINAYIVPYITFIEAGW